MFRSLFVVFLSLQIADAIGLKAEANNQTEFYGMQAGIGNGLCSYEATCTAGGVEGVCVSISAGCCSGSTTSNLCPGSSDIKCCTNNPCSTPSGSGTCKQTSSCTGTSISGYCSGPSDLQCCIETTPSSSELGLDLSVAVSSSTASCLVGNGNSFIIPRGYHSYGAVDTNVCNTIINAANAGFKTRDTYMFPCKTSFIYIICTSTVCSV